MPRTVAHGRLGRRQLASAFLAADFNRPAADRDLDRVPNHYFATGGAGLFTHVLLLVSPLFG
jgi:hypothetical protein